MKCNVSEGDRPNDSRSNSQIEDWVTLVPTRQICICDVHGGFRVCDVHSGFRILDVHSEIVAV